jgi:nicotinamide-nucleotide amidase
MISAMILSIGDELVLGQTVDTNSAWLSQQLAAIGVRVTGHATVPDDQPRIEAAISAASSTCDVLIISGGIGPTEDDLTRQAVAAVMGVPLELNPTALATLTTFFARLNRQMPESNTIQAMLPRGSQMIENTCGTAAGIKADIARPAGGNSRVYVMPGVPREMKAMFVRDIMPKLQSEGGGAAIVSRTLHTFGVGESTVAEQLGALMQRGRNPSVGTTVAGGVVSLRVNAYFDSREKTIEEAERTSAACHQILGDLIYGQDGESLQQVVAGLLRQAGKTVATAESCTGGLLAKTLTDLAGSSALFSYGWVTYANAAKEQLLGVKSETLASHGAVSEEVVIEMASGARARAGSDFALSISGVAGPDGGTEAKPVGMVCIALADAQSTRARTFRFSGDREFVRDRSAKMALAMLRFKLLGKSMPF